MKPKTRGWRTMVFKNRGALLIPVAVVLLVLGRPTPLSASIGVALAVAGELLRIWAVGYSGVTTRADVITAPSLVTAGPYSYMRNPLYVANAIIALGFWCAYAGGVSTFEAAVMLVLVAVCVIGVYAVIIPLEEAYLTGHFGDVYRRYVQRVPRIVPARRRLPLQEQLGAWRGDVIGRAEIITLLFFAFMVLAVYLKLGPWARAGLYF